MANSVDIFFLKDVYKEQIRTTESSEIKWIFTSLLNKKIIILIVMFTKVIMFNCKTKNLSIAKNAYVMKVYHK